MLSESNRRGRNRTEEFRSKADLCLLVTSPTTYQHKATAAMIEALGSGTCTSTQLSSLCIIVAEWHVISTSLAVTYGLLRNWKRQTGGDKLSRDQRSASFHELMACTPPKVGIRPPLNVRRNHGFLLASVVLLSSASAMWHLHAGLCIATCLAEGNAASK